MKIMSFLIVIVLCIQILFIAMLVKSTNFQNEFIQKIATELIKMNTPKEDSLKKDLPVHTEIQSMPRFVPHMDFVELLEEMTDRHHTEKPKDYICCASMRAGAGYDTKITWFTDFTEDINLKFFPFIKGGEGRLGEVYISLDGTPTNQVLDTVLKPTPWNIYVMGPNVHLIYDIFLTSDFSWEDYRDFGEYLENKKWAKHLTALDSNEINCRSQWYEVRLPAAGKRKHQPFWMGVYKEYGNRSGMVLVWIIFDKPDRNLLRCVIKSDNYTKEEEKYMNENIPFVKLYF